jgi:hypothetical protein
MGMIMESPFIKSPRPFFESYDTHVRQSYLEENTFLHQIPQIEALLTFEQVRQRLPDPFWDKHQSIVDCYWRAWELAFSHLSPATGDNGFISNYIDSAFNGNVFMWDSGFMTFFGLYGRRVFNFQRTLDIFYCKQHSDGFICREISGFTGNDAFHRFDPSSTGPNILAWAEWNYYLHTEDRARLETVFPVLLAFHLWNKAYRTWQDGTYWSTGWGCGMDNLPRVAPHYHEWWSHGHLSWIDANIQAILSAKILVKIALLLNREDVIPGLQEEVDNLTAMVNDTMWSEENAFYFDRQRTGRLSGVKHIGAYWALLAEILPEERKDVFIAHLNHPKEFKRLHCIPALSADHPLFDPTGGYWRGGVWAPTNYMVLKGLEVCGYNDLAHEIARNHLGNVVQVFESKETPWLNADQFKKFFHLDQLEIDTSYTLWENYAPDFPSPGAMSKPGYVGWTGLPPIAVFIENILGIKPAAEPSSLVWDVRLLEQHGIKQYPFGGTGQVDLLCKSRKLHAEKPQIEVKSNQPLTIKVIWGAGESTIVV